MESADKETVMYIDDPCICRICCIQLCELDMVSLQDSFDDILKYFELIMLCFPIEIRDNDKLPNFLCNSCKIRLIDTYELRLMCLENNKKLRDSLKLMEIDQLESNFCVQVKDEAGEISITEFKSENSNIQSIDPHDFEDENFELGSYDVKEYEEISEKSLLVDEINDSTNEIQKEKEKITVISIEKLETTDDIEYLISSVSQDIDKEMTENKIQSPIKRKSRKKKTKTDHICEICGKEFDKAYRLLRHANVHNPENRPFSCEICHHRFQSETSLVRHAIVHSDLIIDYTTLIQPTDNREFKCSECEKVFTKQESLSSHLKTHKAEMSQKEFKCDYCPKVFKKLNLLTRHARQHDELKIHQCNICFKTFALNSQLIDHINRHRGIKAHVCSVCNKGFQQSCTLKGEFK